MMFPYYVAMTILLSIVPMQKSLSYDVTIPAVAFKYDTDEWDLNQQVKVGIPTENLAGLSGAQARLFSSFYVADPDDPAQIAINPKRSHCKIFTARPVPFSPAVETPFVLVGALEKNDLRCIGGNLATTVCYLVITKDKMGNQIQLDPDDIDQYFAYAYRFTVVVPPNRPCRTGTEAADHAAEEQRKSHPSAFAKEQKASKEQKPQITKLDGPKACAKILQ